MNRPILPAFIKHYTGSEPTNQMVWYFAYKIVLKYAFQKYKGLRWDIAQFCCGGGNDILQHPVQFWSYHAPGCDRCVTITKLE